MIERKTIQDQIARVRRVTVNLDAVLNVLAKGIEMEPMVFHMEGINVLKLIAVSVEDVATTCDHALDFQRNEAQNKTRRERA